MLAMVLLILFSKGIAEINIAEINIALNRPAMFCNDSNLTTDLVTDGNKGVGKSAIFLGKCDSVAYIDVLLEALYFVHYVVVTEGKEVEELDNALELFVVELYNKTGIREYCSMYVWNSKGPGKDMRVNCWARLANRVRILSQKNIGLSIAEIEAYMLGSGGPEQRPHFYYGCFNRFSNISSPPFTDWKSCLLSCHDHQFAAIYNGTKCLCGTIYFNTYPIEPEHCNIICGNQLCGGHHYYSAYLLGINLPFYMGCIKGAVDDKTYKGDISPPFCINYCMHSDQTYYLVYMKDKTCYCAGSLSESHLSMRWGPDHEDCFISCDDHDSYCGGSKSNVFALSNLPYLETDQDVLDKFVMSMLLTCDGDMDMYGVCKDCRPGFEGSRYCYGKILDEKPNCEMYDPCAYMVDRICDDSKGVYDCICLPGYLFNETTNSCEDIDECKSGRELCPDKVSVCVNFNGSFHCSCYPRFVRVTGLICEPEEGRSRYSKLKILLISLFIFLLVALTVVGMYIWICGKMTHSTHESQDSASTGG